MKKKMLKASEEFCIPKHGIGYVSEHFKKFFYEESFETSSSVGTYVLPKDMTDAEIEAIVDPTTLGDVLYALEHDKLSKETSNLFYLPSCVVGVYWIAVDRKWYVNTSYRGGCAWDAGLQAFSRNLKLSSSAPVLEPSDTVARIEKIEAILKHHNLYD